MLSHDAFGYRKSESGALRIETSSHERLKEMGST